MRGVRRPGQGGDVRSSRWSEHGAAGRACRSGAVVAVTGRGRARTGVPCPPSRLHLARGGIARSCDRSLHESCRRMRRRVSSGSGPVRLLRQGLARPPARAGILTGRSVGVPGPRAARQAGRSEGAGRCMPGVPRRGAWPATVAPGRANDSQAPLPTGRIAPVASECDTVRRLSGGGALSCRPDDFCMEIMGLCSFYECRRAMLAWKLLASGRRVSSNPGARPARLDVRNRVKVRSVCQGRQGVTMEFSARRP